MVIIFMGCEFESNYLILLSLIMIIIILIMIKSKLLTISLRLLLIASGKVCVHVTTNKSHVSGAPSMYSIPHLRSCLEGLVSRR